MGWLDSFWNRNTPSNKDLDLDSDLRKFLEDQAPRAYKTEQEAHADADARRRRTGQSRPDLSPSLEASSKPAETETYRSRLGLTVSTDENKYSKSNTKSISTSTSTSTPTPATTTHDDGSSAQTPPTVPPESLFPDGRYAHLWTTYRSPTSLASTHRSDQEKLLDVLSGYKERQSQLNRAALENCADLHFAVHECFRSGSWGQRWNMCRHENQALGRCVTMQGKLLRALGYLSLYEREEAESERIQMHADRLYAEMLGREAAVREARAKGTPEPVFRPILDGWDDDASAAAADAAETQTLAAAVAESESSGRKTKGARISYDMLPESTKLKLRNARLKGKEGDELELAKRELEEDIAVKLDMVQKMNARFIEEKRERDARYREGTERFGDVVKRYFDFRKYPETQEELEDLTRVRVGDLKKDG